MKESLDTELELSGALLPSSTQMDEIWWRQTWRHIVENYTLRSLTYEEDRIPAIAGITQHIAQVIDDVPILGLWKGSFSRDLA
jgi:hypothetical protein